MYFVDNNKTNWDERYNSFYTFKLHRYTNIRDNDLSKNVTEENQDIEIPMVNCAKVMEDDHGWVG